MTIGYGELRKGMAIELEGEPHLVVEYERSKMQQRAPVIRVKFRELRTGRMVDRTFQGYDVKLIPALVERRAAQYIYADSDFHYFMDVDSYEQYPMAGHQISEALKFLIEQTEVTLVFFNESPITIDLPITVILKVVDSPPGVKGDSAQGTTKPAILETGLEIQVPLFVNEDQLVKVDTRSGSYLSRA